MSDLIDRDELLKSLTTMITSCKGIYGDLGGAINGARELVKSMPSAKKKGIWQKREGSDCWECSNCHAVLERDDIGNHNYYFCYHCGSDNRTMDGWANIE